VPRRSRNVEMRFEFIFLFSLIFGWNSEVTNVTALPSIHQYEFEITILSATTSTHNVANKDVRGCTVSGTHAAYYVVAQVKVSNIGQNNFQIPSQQLQLTDCSETSSYMNMYSFDFPGGPYYKYERCLSDTIDPKLFNCTNMGISAGNFHISTVWIEISDTEATALATAGVDGVLKAHFLPLDINLEAISSPYPVAVSGFSSTPTNYYPCGSCSSCAGQTVITIPSQITFIPNDAFHGCPITNAFIPTTVTGMGNNAFDSSFLRSIFIPTSVSAISDSAFHDCRYLTSISIPTTVTAIQHYAISYCTSLISINIPTSVTFIADSIFYSCTKLISITIPTSISTISNAAFYSCSGLISVSIPTSVSSIGYAVFWSCSSLPTISIPTSVTSIDNNAFNLCTSLKSVSLPTSLVSISVGVFYSCTSLTSISIPTSVTAIGSEAFAYCTSLICRVVPSSIVMDSTVFAHDPTNAC